MIDSFKTAVSAYQNYNGTGMQMALFFASLIYLLIQKYPVTIFGRAFRVLVTGIVPVAYLNFYPAVYLLGKPDAPAWLCMLSPVVALVLACLSAIVWKGGLRHYHSCGG